MRSVTLLGPQRFRPTAAEALEELGVSGQVAIVTAGWQEREPEDQELDDHLGGATVNLQLYRRCEVVFEEDADLAEGHHQRQSRLRQLQRVYRRRLDHALEAAREMMRSEGEAWLLDVETEDAIAAVRELDLHHLARLAEVHAGFEERWRLAGRSPVRRQRAELRETLGRCGAIAIAGGHVAVLLNRLRMFDLFELAPDLPVLAWSAGAMAISDKVVLFHDSPPQGAGNPEVLDVGLGLCPGVVPLPHARRRLRLEDPVRVSLFARRFAPADCVVLEGPARMRFAGGRWLPAAGAAALMTSGEVAPLETP